MVSRQAMEDIIRCTRMETVRKKKFKIEFGKNPLLAASRRAKKTRRPSRKTGFAFWTPLRGWRDLELRTPGVRTPQRPSSGYLQFEDFKAFVVLLGSLGVDKKEYPQHQRATLGRLFEFLDADGDRQIVRNKYSKRI